MPSPFAGMDILTTRNIKREDLDILFDDADAVRRSIAKQGILTIGKGKILATVFLEPSTRTRLSFHFAMVKLGGMVVDFGPAEAASIVKGETFEDSMRMVDGYSPDVIVVRDRNVGAAQAAADVCDAPVINAGDGANEHPTQAMLDLYTMKRIRGSIDGLRIGLMGDLAHSRTIRSLAYALDSYDDVQIIFIAPNELQVQNDVLASLRSAKYRLIERLDPAAEELDFLYLTRLQKERFRNHAEYERLKGSYILNREMISKFGKQPNIMHPLPRVDELNQDIDMLPVAKYFEQARNGMFVRSALLKQVIGR